MRIVFYVSFTCIYGISYRICAIPDCLYRGGIFIARTYFSTEPVWTAASVDIDEMVSFHTTYRV